MSNNQQLRFALAVTTTACLAIILDTIPADAITFKEATKANINFFSGSEQVGKGIFEYSAEPIEGTFVFAPEDTVFFDRDLASIPESIIPGEIVPIESIFIDRSEDLRLVTNLAVSIRGADFEYSQTPLGFGDSFGDVLLFEPTNMSIYPPGSEALQEISTGDPRRPNLTRNSRWFLGDTGGIPERQLSINSDGTYVGFDLNVPSNAPDFPPSGTYVATAVPEPLTILGTGTALGFGAFFKRKLRLRQK